MELITPTTNCCKRSVAGRHPLLRTERSKETKQQQDDAPAPTTIFDLLFTFQNPNAHASIHQTQACLATYSSAIIIRQRDKLAQKVRFFATKDNVHPAPHHTTPRLLPRRPTFSKKKNTFVQNIYPVVLYTTYMKTKYVRALEWQAMYACKAHRQQLRDS